MGMRLQNVYRSITDTMRNHPTATTIAGGSLMTAAFAPLFYVENAGPVGQNIGAAATAVMMLASGLMFLYAGSGFQNEENRK